MFDNLIVAYVNMFYDFQKREVDEWIILKSSVAIKLLNEKYKRFTSEGTETIEQLPLEQKNKYWDISKKYYSEMEQRIKATKAAYTLSLITSND